MVIVRSIFGLLLILALSKEDAAGGGKFMLESDLKNDEEIQTFMISYNRVEGLFLGLGIPKGFNDYYGLGNNLTFYGSIGYGLSNDKIRYRAGLTRKFFGKNSLELGIESFDLTHTEDLWIISRDENTIDALFFHEDYHDFYRSWGSAIYGKQKIGDILSIEAGYRLENQENMKVEKDWSLFRQGEDFRDNPLIQEGEYKNTYLSVELGNSRKLKNWSASLDVEWNSDLISDNMPDYERYIISLSKYQRLGRNDEVNFRVRYGTTFGTVPDQKKFDLGGIGTLRGYGYKEFQNGEKMVLINTEYITDGDAITGLEFLPIFNDFEVAFFADAGIVWNGARDLPNSSELKRNIGIGLQSDDGDFRINFAKPLDGPKDEREIVITFRINHMF